MAARRPLRREVVVPISRYVVLAGLVICLLAGGLALFTVTKARTSHETAAAEESAEAIAERRRVVKEEMEKHRTKGPGAYVPLWPQPWEHDRSFGTVWGLMPLTKVEGPLEKSAVFAVLDENMHRVEDCYSWALLLNLEISGKLEYEWLIQRDGRVDELRKTADTLGDADVAACVEEVLASLRFPEPDGTVTVRFPITYQRLYIAKPRVRLLNH
jgi:hypothetical protein